MKYRRILLFTTIVLMIGIVAGCKKSEEVKTETKEPTKMIDDSESLANRVPEMPPATPTLRPGEKIDPETGEIVANVPDDTEATPEATPTMTPAELYAEAVEKSLISTGNNRRLKRVLEKARNGEDIYVAALGGSVTEGALAKTNDEGYAYQFAEEFKETYCSGDGSNFHFVNAGLSGTPSSLGIMRYQQDVVELLGAQPDILIIEFAINDYNEATRGRAFESLIRRALEANDDCAVILMYSIAKSRWNMQDDYIKMGKYYSVQQVSVKTGLVIKGEEMRVAEGLYFADDYHPTTYGHRLMKDCLMNLVHIVDSEEDSPEIRLPEKDFVNASFKDLIMVDSRNLALDHLLVKPGSFSGTDDKVVTMYFTKKASFPNNFSHVSGKGNEPFTMKAYCKNILINYKTANSNSFGKADIYVDGELKTTVDGYSAGGWNNCNVIMVLYDEEPAEHTLEIKMAEGSEDKEFTILALGYTE